MKKLFTKIFTKILFFFIDKEYLLNFFVSKQEWQGQKLMNKKILDKISDIEIYNNDKANAMLQALRGLNIFVQQSYNPKSQFSLFQFTNLKGEPEILISDLSKLSSEELRSILQVLQKTTNLTISRI